MRLHADLLENLVELAPDAMLIVDATGTVLYANQQVTRLFGSPCEEIVGRKVECLMPERFRVQHGEHRRRFSV